MNVVYLAYIIKNDELDETAIDLRNKVNSERDNNRAEYEGVSLATLVPQADARLLFFRVEHVVPKDLFAQTQAIVAMVKSKRKKPASTPSSSKIQAPLFSS